VRSRDEEQPSHEELASSSPPDERRLRRGRQILLPLIALLLVTLVFGGFLLVRSLGERVSGTSVARDSVDSGTKPSLRLSNGPGQVSIEGGADLETVGYEVVRYALGPDPAAAKSNASDVPVDLSREDSAIVLVTDGGRETGADYALRVPSASDVEIESETGGVEVSGLDGDVTVRAEAGDVEIRDAGGSVTVEAPQGDVTISGINTDTGQAEITVGSGDLSLENVVLGTLEAEVETGEVTLSGRFSGGGQILVQTGDIIARIPSEETANLDLEIRVGEVVREGRGGESQ
jgi:hypothetical protein